MVKMPLLERLQYHIQKLNETEEDWPRIISTPSLQEYQKELKSLEPGQSLWAVRYNNRWYFWDFDVLGSGAFYDVMKKIGVRTNAYSNIRKYIVVIKSNNTLDVEMMIRLWREIGGRYKNLDRAGIIELIKNDLVNNLKRFIKLYNLKVTLGDIKTIIAKTDILTQAKPYSQTATAKHSHAEYMKKRYAEKKSMFQKRHKINYEKNKATYNKYVKKPKSEDPKEYMYNNKSWDDFNSPGDVNYEDAPDAYDAYDEYDL